MRTLTIVAVTAALALLVVAPAAVAHTLIAPDPPKPALVQLCAATDVDAVDDLLAQISTEDIVVALAPLATLTVPDRAHGLRLRSDVQVDDVRDALACPSP